ncbi:PHP domain-containing protein [Estrella lausannensis]|uniref:Phosphoesterase n=1 Tax=Estrella lausannensis TaxID=483423 RepID=A0A0H5DQZ7_9BACT|nr:PHP domain-containing protein [Estrella lausannensis]CRX38049.1 Phosphoesterase [Estrella lausannensis]
MPESDFRADLHCHSTCSDGTLSPEQLIELAISKGLKGLSITDHDSIEAYHSIDSSLHESKIELITGAEFTTNHLGVSVHVLAYGFSPSDEGILELSRTHKIRREERIRQMAHLLLKEGIDVGIEKILEHAKMPGRPHLAMAMLGLGVIKEPKEAFEKYIGDGKRCFVKSHAIGTEETVSIIKRANAIPVIAHPHLVKESRVLRDILLMDFEGIEAYYANFPLGHCQKWLDIARNKRWIITGGSDFHGEVKPQIALGASYTPEESFKRIAERYAHNKIR